VLKWCRSRQPVIVTESLRFVRDSRTCCSDCCYLQFFQTSTSSSAPGTIFVRFGVIYADGDGCRNRLVARLQLLPTSRRLAQRHGVARQRLCIGRCLGRDHGDAELLAPDAARLSDLHGVRQRDRLPQHLPGEGAAHCHQLLHRVAGDRRHHGRHSRYAASCLRRGSSSPCLVHRCNWSSSFAAA